MDRNFEIPKKTPELFNNPESITLKRNERIEVVSIEVTPEGVYDGNGKYQDPQGAVFRIIGFDRSNGREFWIGQGYIRTTKD